MKRTHTVMGDEDVRQPNLRFAVKWKIPFNVQLLLTEMFPDLKIFTGFQDLSSEEGSKTSLKCFLLTQQM